METYRQTLNLTKEMKKRKQHPLTKTELPIHSWVTACVRGDNLKLQPQSCTKNSYHRPKLDIQHNDIDTFLSFVAAGPLVIIAIDP